MIGKNASKVDMLLFLSKVKSLPEFIKLGVYLHVELATFPLIA